MRTLLFHLCLHALSIRSAVYVCFPFALAYLDVSVFCHILFRLGNFFGWCDVVQLMLTCEQFTDVWSFLVFFSFLSVLLHSFLSQGETSRLLLDPAIPTVYKYICMHDFSFFSPYSYGFHIHIHIYIHLVDFVIITTILFVSNFCRLTTAISLSLSLVFYLFSDISMAILKHSTLSSRKAFE